MKTPCGRKLWTWSPGIYVRCVRGNLCDSCKKKPPRLSATKLADKYLRDVFPDRDKLVQMFRNYARSRRWKHE